MVCQLYFTMDFGIGCELVHPSVTLVQILRAVGLMAAIIALMLVSDSRVLKHYINEDMESLQESVQQLNFVTQIQAPRILQGEIKNKKR